MPRRSDRKPAASPSTRRIGEACQSPGMPPVTDDSTTMAGRFRALAEEWKKQAAPISDTNEIVELSAYRQIISLGSKVIPEILRELDREPDLWFSALERLTGVDPVQADDYGDIEAMARSWLSWAKKQGYCL